MLSRNELLHWVKQNEILFHQIKWFLVDPKADATFQLVVYKFKIVLMQFVLLQ